VALRPARLSSYAKLGFKPVHRYGVGVLADIKSLTREELADQFKAWELPAYRLDQLLN